MLTTTYQPTTPCAPCDSEGVVPATDGPGLAWCGTCDGAGRRPSGLSPVARRVIDEANRRG